MCVFLSLFVCERDDIATKFCVVITVLNLKRSFNDSLFSRFLSNIQKAQEWCKQLL